MEVYVFIFCFDYLIKGLINLEFLFFLVFERNDFECEGSRNFFNEDFICVIRKGWFSFFFLKNYI